MFASLPSCPFLASAERSSGPLLSTHLKQNDIHRRIIAKILHLLHVFIDMDSGEQGTHVPERKEATDRQLRKPFAGWTSAKLDKQVDEFIEKSGLRGTYDKQLFRKGALLAQSRTAFSAERADGLRLENEERTALGLENSDNPLDRFKQPRRLYALVVLCSLGAAVQGWYVILQCYSPDQLLTIQRDQTAVNGAQLYFREKLDIEPNSRVLGLVNGAPYLCCALACFLNYPLNRHLGRRGVIFATCLISSITCLLQAFSQTWWHLFLARFALGFGIGPKSATIPIYAAEAAPENIRGALVMMWQMWTAFGIMCGYISGVVLAGVGTDNNLNWRLMLGSPVSGIAICFTSAKTSR
jgi:hypothetical protein